MIENTTEIEKCVEKAWLEVKQDTYDRIWWNEMELVMAFYFHLRPEISKLDERTDNVRLRIIPFYTAKAPKDAKEYEKKYPILKNKKTERPANYIDLCIAAFDAQDFDFWRQKGDHNITYWYIRHDPVVLLEFKLDNKASVLREMKKDFKKLGEHQRLFEGIRALYFCYLSPNMIMEEEIRKITDLEDLTICFGIWNEEWGIM